MSDALPLRIFLASPGGLEAERYAVHACIDEHNARAGDQLPTFEVVGWEQVRGTARRPQEAINELIGECHFLVALFRDQWGSAPGSPWGYTSGTEEELFEALLELGRSEQPMRDVWVAFLAHDRPAVPIQRLREQMERHHAMLYEPVSDTRDLKEKLTQRLQGWASSLEPKAAKHIDLLPSSGRDVLRAANQRTRGEKLVELGQTEAGLLALEEAATLGGPAELLAYAKQRSRAGDTDGALQSAQQAIEYFVGGDHNIYSTLAAEAFAAQAGFLRRKRSFHDAIGRLEQALTLLNEGDPGAIRVRCRILDDIGLANQALGDNVKARERFEEALEARRAAKLEHDEWQSVVNLARLDLRDGNTEGALVRAERAAQELRKTPPTALHANAETLVAQVLIAEGRGAEGLPHAERALAINRQIAYLRGEAIALMICAECSRAAGALAPAEQFARDCLEVNLRAGDAKGESRARQFLAEIGAGSTGHPGAN